MVCPTNVEPADPRSYYSVAERMNKDIPNSYWCNQYDNLSNTAAHYESTGPEIWEQTDGQITHLVVGVGTGGTVSGTARYLKEKNPQVKIWGIDTFGSVFKKRISIKKDCACFAYSKQIIICPNKSPSNRAKLSALGFS